MNFGVVDFPSLDNSVAICSRCIRGGAQLRSRLIPLRAPQHHARFGAAVGVHPATGYLSVTHLGPAVLGCVVFAAGLALAALDSGASIDATLSTLLIRHLEIPRAIATRRRAGSS